MRISNVVTEIEGRKHETIYYKKGAAVWTASYINGEKISEHRVYKINTERPYIHWLGTKFYITDEYLDALKAIL